MTSKAESKTYLNEIHIKFAKQCFNSAWEYLDKEKLAPEEELNMLHLAHASSFHWSKVGSPENFAISDWQVSRCYTKIGDGISALKYAQRCLQITFDNKVTNNYVSAYEGMARAYAILQDFGNAKKFIDLAEKEFDKIVDKEDRAVLEPQIKDTQSKIK